MKKVLGIFGLLVFVCVFTLIRNPDFVTSYNIYNTIRWTGLFGIISIGVAFVIITGGIDLSIGSVVGLVGCVLPWLLTQHGFGVGAALGISVALSLSIGLLHGLLITKLRLQPFVVTLCGLLFYRGFARWLTDDQTQGFGTGYETLKYMASGKPFSFPVPFLKWISEGHWSPYKVDRSGVQVLDEMGDRIPLDMIEWVPMPMPFLIMLGVAIVAGVFLNYTIWGRYLLALGRNEEAARYSGINTDRMVILAYVICSFMAGLAGVLFGLDINSVQPSGHGNFYELYAIAAAVLGGCSLRGGEGSILGVVIGAAVMRVLYNSINLLGIPTQLEFAIIGAVILAGVIVDELFKRLAARRRAAKEASG